MLGSEDEFKTVRNARQVCPRLFGDMRGMIVQDYADTLPRRIVAVRQLEKLDELRAPVLIPHQAQHLSLQ
jgi:hypothetical protein